MASTRDINDNVSKVVSKCSTIIISAQELLTEMTALKSELREELAKHKEEVRKMILSSQENK